MMTPFDDQFEALIVFFYFLLFNKSLIKKNYDYEKIVLKFIEFHCCICFTFFINE